MLQSLGSVVRPCPAKWLKCNLQPSILATRGSSSQILVCRLLYIPQNPKDPCQMLLKTCLSCPPHIPPAYRVLQPGEHLVRDWKSHMPFLPALQCWVKGSLTASLLLAPVGTTMAHSDQRRNATMLLLLGGPPKDVHVHIPLLKAKGVIVAEPECPCHSRTHAHILRTLL